MKSFAEVEKTRREYHAFPDRKSVHRSSLIVPNLQGMRSYVSFLNHFLLKRGYASVACKITAISPAGGLVDSIATPIDQPIVYTFDLDALFEAPKEEIGLFIVEFYSERNLFIPFPAVMVNHVGDGFVNVVHSFNRILNDVFEDDAVNKTAVSEASICVTSDNRFDTFFNVVTGMQPVDDDLLLEYSDAETTIERRVHLSMSRLSQKSFYLSEVMPDVHPSRSGVVRIAQPKQFMFYGRLLAGSVERGGGAFSANHSYYDTSVVEEYLASPTSYRSYPFFPGRMNKVVMYPIMSPGRIAVEVRATCERGEARSEAVVLTSPSHVPIEIDVTAIVAAANLGPCSAFSVVAADLSGKGIPSRVNHQLVYANMEGRSSLSASMNVSLFNETNVVPPGKKGFTWGQMLTGRDYQSQLGLCFGSTSGEAEEIEIEIYDAGGKRITFRRTCVPGRSVVIDADEVYIAPERPEFIWFVARSRRHDLTAYVAHMHKESGHSSGEHSF